MKILRKKIIAFGVVLAVLITSYDYTFNKPTVLNKQIAMRVMGAPAHSSFVDDNFYSCVLDAYNKKNNTSVPYTQMLTDEQLATITHIDCDNTKNDETLKIIDTSGLEKLSNLEILYLEGNKISDIDVSQNPKLRHIDLSSNNINNVDVRNNLVLTSLELDDNSLINVDVTNNDKLTNLSINNNNLSNIDVSNNMLITNLNLSSNNLSQINISNLNDLVYFNISSNKLKTIDVSHNINLTGLDLSVNELESLNVSENVKLTTLDLWSNDNLNSIDVANNILLKTLDLGYCGLSQIDVSTNLDLTTLNLSGNQLNNIDISKNIMLSKVTLYSNNLSEIDLSNNNNLVELSIYLNNLTNIDISRNLKLKKLDIRFNKLNAIDVGSNLGLNDLLLTENYLESIVLHAGLNLSNSIGTQYSSQKFIDLGDNKIIEPIDEYIYYFNDKISLTSEYSIDDFIENMGLQNLDYKILDGEEEITEGNIKDGYILEIYNGESLVQSSKLEIYYNEMFPDYNFYKCVIDSYNKQNNTDYNYKYQLSDDELKQITILNCSGSNKTENEKIIDAQGIEKLTLLQKIYLSNNNLESIILDNNNNIEVLSLNNNKLSSINLNNNINLTQVSMENNNLKEINIDNLEKLNDLRLSNNKINNISLKNNSELRIIYLQNNDLSSLDTSHNLLLSILSISGNNIKNLDVTKNINLTDLSAENNELNSINLQNNVKLEELIISSNKLSELDLTKNTSLTYLSAHNNSLTTIDLSNNPNLKILYVSKNNLNSLNVSTGVEVLDISENNFTSIDLSDFSNLNSLEIKGNNFHKEIATYVGNQIDLNNQYLVVLPEHTQFELLGIDNPYSEIVVNNKNIDTLKAGNYKVKYLYAHNLQSLIPEEYNETYDLYVIEATSDKYLINNEQSYIYTKNDNDYPKILNNIKVNYGQASIDDGSYIIINNEEIIKEFKIINIDFGKLNVSDNVIVLNRKFNYEEFVQNISINGLNYKVIKGNEEINSGVIESDVKLNVYYNDDLIDTYEIEYLDLNNLDVDNQNKVIYNIPLNTTVNTLSLEIPTNGKIKLLGLNNKDKTNNDIVGTGDKLVIELDSLEVEYTLSIKGDLTGDGVVKINDISKLYQSLKGKVNLSQYELSAGDIAGSDGLIKINDVSKLYQFLKGKLTQIEVPKVASVCEFGSLITGESTNDYPLALIVGDVDKGCAINKDLWDDETITSQVNSIYQEDYKRLRKQLEPLLTEEYPSGANVEVRPLFQAVLNQEKTGLVGYRIYVDVYINDSQSTEKIDQEKNLKLSYYIQQNKIRSYLINEYNIAG